MDGYSRIVRFDNGYRASVVCNKMSYGGDRGLFEIAILNKDGKIDYKSPLTNDVLGFLDFSDVVEILEKIKNLPSK